MSSELKQNIKDAFTKFPYCIATYVTLAGFIAFLASPLWN